MTREETRELLPIMEAYSEGKIIQIWDESKSIWVNLDEAAFCSSPDKYRIKPEPKYRPFKSREECWQEMHNHSDFGWLTRIDTGNFERIKSVCQETIEFVVTTSYLYEDAFKYYKFPDGTPFGIKED